MAGIVPKGITRTDQGVLIDWDGQGHTAFYPARALRLACPCAQCVEEMTGRTSTPPPCRVAGFRLATSRAVSRSGASIT